jgi:hypothetical protein
VRLPWLVSALGYAGLLPFLLGPAWLTFAPATAPEWLDAAWAGYVTLLAAFLAGTFWGFALPAIEGPNGLLGMFIASGLLLLTWVTMVMTSVWQLYLLALVFLLQLLADYWRERTLDTIPGYFRLRVTLTAGALLSIGWFLVL